MRLSQELEVKRVGEGIQLVLNENAVFDTNKSSLTADAKANLEKLVPVLQNILILILPFLVILISPVLQTII
jgi:outer membrane protein OmpA-like peptidoglycan-associated protein